MNRLGPLGEGGLTSLVGSLLLSSAARRCWDEVLFGGGSRERQSWRQLQRATHGRAQRKFVLSIVEGWRDPSDRGSHVRCSRALTSPPRAAPTTTHTHTHAYSHRIYLKFVESIYVECLKERMMSDIKFEAVAR